MTVIKFKVPEITNLRRAADGSKSLHSQKATGWADTLLRLASGFTGDLVHSTIVNSKAMANSIEKEVGAAKSYTYQPASEQIQDFTKATKGRVPVFVSGADGKLSRNAIDSIVHTKDPSKKQEFVEFIRDHHKFHQNAYTAGVEADLRVPVTIGKDPNNPEGFIHLANKLHPSTPLHEMGHYYQAVDADFNPSHPGLLKRIVDPTSSAKYKRELDAWDRMGVPADERERVLALKSYELGGLRTRHQAYGAAINAGAVAGGGLLIRQAVKAKRAKAVAAALAKRESEGAQTQKVVLGAAGAGAAGLGAYLLNNRRKGNE